MGVDAEACFSVAPKKVQQAQRVPPEHQATTAILSANRQIDNVCVQNLVDPRKRPQQNCEEGHCSASTASTETYH
jgi:hypothetical protein